MADVSKHSRPGARRSSGGENAGAPGLVEPGKGGGSVGPPLPLYVCGTTSGRSRRFLLGTLDNDQVCPTAVFLGADDHLLAGTQRGKICCLVRGLLFLGGRFLDLGLVADGEGPLRSLGGALRALAAHLDLE